MPEVMQKIKLETKLLERKLIWRKTSSYTLELLVCVSTEMSLIEHPENKYCKKRKKNSQRTRSCAVVLLVLTD